MADVIPADNHAVGDTGHVSDHNNIADVLTAITTSPFSGGLFGDSSDSTQVLDGTVTPAWATKSGSIYTMTRDANLTSLTINSGVTLKPVGYRIFCRGTVTNNGTISNAGNNATSATGASSTGSGSNAGGRAGGNGGTTTGTAASVNGSGGASGTAGGTGSSGVGGIGAAATALYTQWWKNPVTALMGFVGSFAAGLVLAGGQGGGGGGGDGTNSGGGGGGGAGPIIIFAFAVINNGTITSAGGNGFTPTTGNCGGGGAGGGGLILIYTLSAWTAGTTSVAGGTPGSGVGSGTAGTTGIAGLMANIIMQ